MLGLIGLLTAVGAAASWQPQPQGARPGWPCVGRPDPSMVQVSEASGGQIFLLDPSEVASSASLLLASDGHDETLRRIVQELEPGTRTIDVPVDGSVERVLFSVSLQCLQAIEVVRPSGSIVAASDQDVSWTAFQAGRQIGVRAPAAGVWQIRLAGRGLLFLVAQARASLSLETVRVVRLGGRPGHEGLIRDEDPLVPGTRRLIEVRLSPGILDPRFQMRASTDWTLGGIPLASQAPDDPGTFLGEFVVPATTFRVVVTGRDTAGNAVQRAQPPLFLLSQSR